MKAALNQLPRADEPRVGMGRKAQTTAIPVGIARICNAAARPDRGCAGRVGLVQRCLTRRAACFALAAAALAGCGFAPQTQVVLPFNRLAVVGLEPGSAMAAALAQALPPTVTLTSTPADADVVLRVLRERLTRTVVASTAAGEVRELRLRADLRFALEGPPPASRTWLAATDIEQARDMSFTETAALAKEREQRWLIEHMQRDLAQQLVRVLAHARAPAVAPSASAPSGASSGASAADAASASIPTPTAAPGTPPSAAAAAPVVAAPASTASP